VSGCPQGLSCAFSTDEVICGDDQWHGIPVAAKPDIGNHVTSIHTINLTTSFMALV
jgi:hypothetical protein